MGLVVVVTILLGFGCMNNLVNLVRAQEGCISHPLPSEVVDKIVAAANNAISQRNEKCSSKEDSNESVDGHALATLALLQHSLSATKEEFSASKMDWEKVSSTLRELSARTNDWDNAVAGVSSLPSSLSSTQSELATSKRDCNNGLTEIQSTVEELRNELAELRKNYESVTSKSAKCKDGWFLFQNSCYFFSNAKDTWEGGRQQCLNLGADYVKISTDDELAFIFSLVVDNTWVGLSDLQSEGAFKWISDGTIHKINMAWWLNGQPDNGGNQEDCVHIWFVNGRKLLNDTNCIISLLYICEMTAETNIG